MEIIFSFAVLLAVFIGIWGIATVAFNILAGLAVSADAASSSVAADERADSRSLSPTL